MSAHDDPLDVAAHAADDFCYVTTTGRRSGRPHTIEIWFVAYDGAAYLFAQHHGSDWVRNLRAGPAVRLRLGDTEVPATATVVDDPADPRQHLRTVMADKYGEYEDDGSPTDFSRTALLVEIRPDRR